MTTKRKRSTKGRAVRGPSRTPRKNVEGLMDDELMTFLTELAGSVEKLSDFIADPKAAAESAGLSEESRDVLFSGDQNRIYLAIGGIQLTAPGKEGEEAAVEQASGPATMQIVTVVAPQYAPPTITVPPVTIVVQAGGVEQSQMYGQQQYSYPSYPPTYVIVMPYYYSPWGGYVR